MEKLVVESFYGFGDTIFIRPLLIAQAQTKDVYVQTPYPELFLNTPVKPVRPGNFMYDFANRAMDTAEGYFEKPTDAKFLRPTYSVEDLKNYRTVSKSFSRGLDFQVYDTRLEPTDKQIILGKELVQTDKPILIVKIPSYRHDWLCESRTPRTAYMIECMKIAKENGMYIVSLQDYTLGDRLGEPELEKEWLPLCDKTLHGRLSVDQLIGLFSIADSVLTYPNFLLPLAIYLDKPVFCLYGGSVHPQVIIDPRINPYHYYYLAPDPFCHCVESHHDCNKDIPIEKIKNKFEDFLLYEDDDEGLIWSEEFGYGYYPVKDFVYGDNYYDKYAIYEKTEFGDKLNKARVEIANKYSQQRIIDIGIGSGQFVKSVDGLGYDVCPKAIEWLKNNNRWVDFYRFGAYNADLVTFFDSFEHIDNIEEVVNMCLGRNILISIPIFKDKNHVLNSKHFRKDEHFHYFTDQGLKTWFARYGYRPAYESTIESDLGREGINTYLFTQSP